MAGGVSFYTKAAKPDGLPDKEAWALRIEY